ncbi:MAG: PEP-CTERM sorting domain-containing protein [Armatimonadetes bacterium]|nr:PEP-CTERM sorting domain-containing protein [Armatimonadota bacterium]
MTISKLALVTGSLGLCGSALASPVTIVNPSFEDNFASDWSYPSLVPNGWTVIDPNGIIGGGDLTGVVNPTGSTFFNSGVPDGRNAAYIYLSEQIGQGPVSLSQTLTATLQANTHYHFQVGVGNIAAGFSSDGNNYFDLTEFPGYMVQVLANGVVLAEDNNSLAIPDGEFGTSVLDFDTGASDPQLGQAIEIRLTNLNMRSSAQHPGVEVDFDMAQMDASPVPEPGTFAVAVFGLAGLMLRRRTHT